MARARVTTGVWKIVILWGVRWLPGKTDASAESLLGRGNIEQVKEGGERVDGCAPHTVYWPQVR